MDMDDVNDEDDEETLNLKLQQIQAQLRLKKLRKAKAQQSRSAAIQEPEQNDRARPDSAPMMRVGVRTQSRVETSRPQRTVRVERPKSQMEVQVPASPVRKAPPPSMQTSPSRVLLGIDKGRNAKDISLKRAPSLRRPKEEPASPPQAGGYLRRAKTPVAQLTEDQPRPLSFNERLAAARTEESDRQETRERAQRQRSNAFNIGRQEMEHYKTAAVEIPPSQDRGYSRNDTPAASFERPKGGYLHRSNTVPSRIGALRSDPDSSELSQPPLATSSFSFESTKSEPQNSPESTSFEPYSGFHLSNRILPHQVVARALSGKKTYDLQKLLKQVKAPDWSFPDDVSDAVVLGIVSSKSDPKHHKPTFDSKGQPKASDRGKYMVITLVDLKYEVELYLFNTGFERFWKISTGTVVAILNPTIMPPPPGRQDTGKFGLVINSDGDMILEIGHARDLGYCKSKKADGQLCSTWVNARRTEHCEFHTNEAVRKMRGSRIELNGGGGFGGGERPRSRYTNTKKPDAKVPKSTGYDRGAHAQWFMSASGSGGSRVSAATLIDRGESVADTQERATVLKRRLVAKEKERDIAKKLGDMGSGAGREYMRTSGVESRAGASRTAKTGLGSSISSSATLQGTQDPEPRKTDARSLGLLPPQGAESKISLSPIKRKRTDSSFTSSTGGGNSFTGGGGGGSKTIHGWGTGLKDKLSRMKAGEKLNLNLAGNGNTNEPVIFKGSSAMADRTRGDRSPVRKKTRFVTSKGIREAGRESVGTELSGDKNIRPAYARRQVTLQDDDDDDDELVIVR